MKQHVTKPIAITGIILDVNLPSIIGDYNNPRDAEEWLWVENNASYAHASNNRDGVWEFILNTSMDFLHIPAKLQGIINSAKTTGASYILFHQGT